MSVAIRRRKAAESVENTATYLIYAAEQFSNTGLSMYDLMCRRREVLASARKYAAALRRLATAR